MVDYQAVTFWKLTNRMHGTASAIGIGEQVSRSLPDKQSSVNDTMQYHVLAADFDGTLAEQGVVPQSTLDALQRIKDSGRKLVLVSGRRLEPLLDLLPDIRTV